VILVLAVSGISAASAIVGCGGSETSSSGGGGSGGSGGSSGSSMTGGYACSPKDPACNVVKSEDGTTCIALTDYKGQTSFTLRMANLSLTAPAALASGLVKGIVENGVTMNLQKCNLSGGGTFNWLMQFDTTTGKLKTGGAKPAADPAKGYSFIDGEMLGGITISPVEIDAPVGTDGKFSTAMGADVVVPIFLDAMATQYVLLPLKNAKLGGTVSADNNCIGEYNAKGLDPANNCLGDATNPTFVNAGTLDGYITLEDADSVIVDTLKQSLCVLLSGDAAQYGDGGTPNKCKRDANNKIIAEGEYCDATKMAGDCKDSVVLGATFAASAVQMN